MGPTPPSLSTASSSGGAQSPDAEFRIVRKRNRVPLSCGACRHRKLKCNRSHPCENCIKRGEAASCTYATPGSRKKSLQETNTTPDGMQDRIDRLEGLILSMMTNGPQSAGPTAANAAITRSLSDTPSTTTLDTELDDVEIRDGEEDEEDSEMEAVADTLGMLKVDMEKGKSMYIGQSHWHTVLKDVQEVKNYFLNHKREFEKNYEQVVSKARPKYTDHGCVLLLGNHETASDMEIRAELPPKSTVDKLVTRFLESDEPMIPILHPPTFKKQLLKHWQDPSKSSLEWLGLVYAVMCLAMRTYDFKGDEPPEWKGRTGELTKAYRLKTVQCLVNSDYTKPSHVTIHTLIFYMNSEYGSRFDADLGLWALITMVARLAMRMGYHRDPSRYTGLTPFAAEMRRRMWAYIRQLDTLIAFHLGMPASIKDVDCDMALPRNLHDEELDPDSEELPPERPIEEVTAVSYVIARCKVMLEFATILEFHGALHGKGVSYDEIMKHDNILREIKAQFPPMYRMKPWEELPRDSPFLIIKRSALEILWLKAMVVLHRNHLNKAHQNHRYTHSRRACVDASMALLRIQHTNYRQSLPGGYMEPAKKVLERCTQMDYLLGAMIVCLDLRYEHTISKKPLHHSTYFWTPEQRADMLQAIEMSYEIWKLTAEHSVEAFKASMVLGLVLDALRRSKAPQPETPSPMGSQASQPTFASTHQPFQSANLKPEESAAMTLGMLSGGLSPNSEAMMNNMNNGMNMGFYNGLPAGASSASLTPPGIPMDGTGFGTMPLSLFSEQNNGNMMDTSTNLDWEAWDAYVQYGSNVESNYDFFAQGNGDMPANLNGMSALKNERSLSPGDAGLYNNPLFMTTSPQK